MKPPSPALFKKGLVSEHLGHIIIIVICIAVIIAAVLLIKKYKLIQKLKPIFRKNIYWQQYKLFIKNLDYKLKYSIKSKKQYIILNTTDRSLLESRQEIQKFKYNHYSNDKTNSGIIFGLTKKLFIVNLAKNILIKNTKEAKKDLLKFFKKSYKYSQPTVIVYIDYTVILTSNTNEVNQHLLTVRNTLNTIYNAIGVCNIFVSITGFENLDKIDNFNKFLSEINENYLILNDISEKINRDFKNTNNRVIERFGYLAVNDEDAETFIKGMQFIDLFDKINKKIPLWLKDLTVNDDIIKPPLLKGTYLDLTNDLNIIDSLKTFQKTNFTHRNIVASVLGIIAVVLIIKTAVCSYDFIAQALKQIDKTNNVQIINASSSQDNEKLINNEFNILGELKNEINTDSDCMIYSQNSLMYSARSRVAENIYKKILQHKIFTSSSPDQLIFLLFTSHVSNNNSLRAYLADNSAKLALTMNIDKRILDFYIEYSNQIPRINFSGEPAYLSLKNNEDVMQNINVLLNEYKNLVKRNNITLSDINNFLDNYNRIYTKELVINKLLNKFYPLSNAT